MGYDLSPLSDDVEEGFHFGAFSWSWFLGTGVGLVIGTAPCIHPGSYRFTPDENGRDPHCNDGFVVSAEQAKIMATLARNLVKIEKGRRQAWDEPDEATREEASKFGSRSYIKPPVREDFVEKAAKFADWAEKSGGFEIH
jgi:hypothetical protein